MVVGAAGAPIFYQESQIEIPVGHFCFSAGQLFYGTRAERYRSKTRRATEAFLGACVHNVDAPFIGEEGHATEAGHRVDQQQAIVLMTKVANPFQGLAGATWKFRHEPGPGPPAGVFPSRPSTHPR